MAFLWSMKAVRVPRNTPIARSRIAREGFYLDPEHRSVNLRKTLVTVVKFECDGYGCLSAIYRMQNRKALKAMKAASKTMKVMKARTTSMKVMKATKKTMKTMKTTQTARK